MLNWSEGDPHCGGSSWRGDEREDMLIPICSGRRELPKDEGTDMVSGGNWEWNPSAAIG